MSDYPKPINEERRVAVLCSINILDTDPEERYDRITRLAKKFFNVPIALVTFIDENRQWYKSVQGLENREVSRENSFCTYAILDKNVMIVNDAHQDKRFFNNPHVKGAPNVRFYAGCPLELKDDLLIGTLCIIDKTPREFTKDEETTLKDLANMVEAELRMLNQAISDELTGLLNRKGLFDFGKHYFNQTKELELSITLFYIDLDDFKKINDTFGHHVGDIALKSMADILNHSCRDMDLIARLGGDEFCLLCTNMDEQTAAIVEKRLEKNVNEFNERKENKFRLKYSLGKFSAKAKDYPSFQHLVDEADKLMYQQKKSKPKS